MSVPKLGVPPLRDGIRDVLDVAHVVRVHADLGGGRGSGQQSGNDGDGEQGEKSAHGSLQRSHATRFLRSTVGRPVGVRGAPFYVVLCLLLRSRRGRAPRPRRARPATKALWTEADKDGFGTAHGHAQQGLAHARRRRADRGLLPRHRHAGVPRPAVRRLRREVVRRARAREREPCDLARRQALADLPPGQHDLALQDRQDLRDRPGAQRAGRRRQVHVAHRQEARALRARRPGALQRRRRRLRPQRRAARSSRATPTRRRRSSPRRPSRAPRAATSARATAGPTCARTSAWTGPTTRRRTATSCRPAGPRSTASSASA